MYCKFNKNNEFQYTYFALTSDDGKLKALNKDFNTKVNKLENSLVSMQKELAEKNSLINALQEKIKVIEDVFNNFKEDIKDKNSKISALELKLDELEKKQKSENMLEIKNLKNSKWP